MRPPPLSSSAPSPVTSEADAIARAQAEAEARAEAERQRAAAAAKRAQEALAAAAQAREAALARSKPTTRFDATDSVKNAQIAKMKPPAGTQLNADQLKAYRATVGAVMQNDCTLSLAAAAKLVDNLKDDTHRTTAVQALAMQSLGRTLAPDELASVTAAGKAAEADGGTGNAVTFLTQAFAAEQQKVITAGQSAEDKINAAKGNVIDAGSAGVTLQNLLPAHADLSSTPKLTADQLAAIMPKLAAPDAPGTAAMMQQAFAVAGVKTPEQVAAFTAMVAQKTDQLSGSTAFPDVVAAAQAWKAQSLNGLAQHGQLNQVADKLGIPVTAQQLKGSSDAMLAGELDQVLAEKKCPAAGQRANGQTAGELMVAAGKKWNVDPRVLLAIAGHETGYGTLGVGVAKMLGVSAYDSNPDGNFGMNGFQAQIQVGAETFNHLRAKGGSSANAPIADQLAAVNQAGWATDNNWHNGVLGMYDSNKDQLKGGPPAVGQAFYDRALTALGGSAPSTSTSPTASSSAAPVSSSGSSFSGPSGGSSAGSSGGGGGGGGGGAPAPAQASHAPAHPSHGNDSALSAAPTLDELAQQYQVSAQALQDAMSADLSDSVVHSSSVTSDPAFAKFMHSLPGMKHWKAGDKVSDKLRRRFLAMKVAQLAKKNGGTKSAVVHAAQNISQHYEIKHKRTQPSANA